MHAQAGNPLITGGGGATLVNPSSAVKFYPTWASQVSAANYVIGIKASLQVPTAGENRPTNISQPIILYLGRPAQI
jgi:hypothetical protein